MFNLKALFAASALLVLLVLVAACRAPSVPPNVTEVTLTANNNGCSPASFDTRQGYIVYVTLENDASTEVSFVYANGPYTFSAPTGQSVKGNFTSPTVTGDYSFQCGPTGTNNMTTGRMRVK